MNRHFTFLATIALALAATVAGGQGGPGTGIAWEITDPQFPGIYLPTSNISMQGTAGADRSTPFLAEATLHPLILNSVNGTSTNAAQPAFAFSLPAPAGGWPSGISIAIHVTPFGNTCNNKVVQIR